MTVETLEILISTHFTLKLKARWKAVQERKKKREHILSGWRAFIFWSNAWK